MKESDSFLKFIGMNRNSNYKLRLRTEDARRRSENPEFETNSAVLNTNSKGALSLQM